MSHSLCWPSFLMSFVQKWILIWPWTTSMWPWGHKWSSAYWSLTMTHNWHQNESSLDYDSYMVSVWVIICQSYNHWTCFISKERDLVFFSWLRHYDVITIMTSSLLRHHYDVIKLQIILFWTKTKNKSFKPFFDLKV